MEQLARIQRMKRKLDELREFQKKKQEEAQKARPVDEIEKPIVVYDRNILPLLEKEKENKKKPQNLRQAKRHYFRIVRKVNATIR